MKGTMLVVDNMEVNYHRINQLFIDEYQVIQAENKDRAIEIIAEKGGDISIVLINLDILDGGGTEVLKFMNQENSLAKIPVIILSQDSSLEKVSKEYNLDVSEIIQIPYSSDIVKKRINNIVDLYAYKFKFNEMLDQQMQDMRLENKKLVEMNYRIIDKLGSIVEFRNIESGAHIIRVREFTKVLLKYIMKFYPEYEINEHRADVIAYASAMHDIGKIAIPDSILLKPGKLTTQEFEIIKSHTIKGGEILERTLPIDDAEYMYYCYNIARSHHEKYDGKGYPDGLKGEEIPIEAQVVSLADVYDSLISERVYKQAYSKEKAIEMILHGECGVFNHKLLNCLGNARIEFENIADEIV